MKRKSRWIAILMTILLMIPTVLPSIADSGSMWTTDINGQQNQNAFYPSKLSVYLNVSGFDPGSYYVKVESPNGTLLGDSNLNAGIKAPFIVGPDGKDLGGVAVGTSGETAFQLWLLVTQTDNSVGYANTDNSGGTYKVTISKNANFNGGSTKTDNFKALSDATTGALTINKVIDNQLDAVDGDIPFDILVTGPAGAGSIVRTVTINGNGTSNIVLPFGTYTISEPTLPTNYSLIEIAPSSVSLSLESRFASTTVTNHYTAPIIYTPGISIEKLTNGVDADVTPGPSIIVGQAVNWTYVVTNTGNVTLTDITVTDDQGVIVTLPKTSLAPGESMTGTASGTAVAGQYTNIGTATGTPPEGQNVSDTDVSHYFGSVPDAPGINIEKLTNGVDADSAPGPSIIVGQTVNWTYVVTNIGNVTLTDITVSDDRGVIVSLPKTSLEPGESMTGTASGTAVAGQYTNVGTATGTPPVGPDVTDTDSSHYFGSAPDAPGITINKTTNGSDGPSILVGSTVTWSYVVTNTGNVDLTNIVVTDIPEGQIGTLTSLAVGATHTFTKTGIAAFGPYTNTGTVVANYGEAGTVSASDGSSYTGYTIPTPPPPTPPVTYYGSINLLKFLDSSNFGVKDATEFTMPGITFELFNANKIYTGKTATTNVDGKLSFTGLDFGTYYLKEVGDNIITTSNFTADGFSNPIAINSTTAFEIVVGNQYVVPPVPPIPPQIEEVPEDETPQAAPVVPAAPLPQTGELPPYFAYGFGALLVLAGLFLKRKY